MRAARTDANHGQIVAALKAAGWRVVSTARMGGGFPDLVVARRGVVRLIEVKTDRGALTRDQVEFHEGFPVVILRTIDDAVRLA